MTEENWNKEDEERQDIIGQNGNNGEHYKHHNLTFDRLKIETNTNYNPADFGHWESTNLKYTIQKQTIYKVKYYGDSIEQAKYLGDGKSLNEAQDIAMMHYVKNYRPKSENKMRRKSDHDNE